MIPGFIVKDTYYLKAKIVAASLNSIPESTLQNNVGVSDPLTACSDTNTMTGTRRSLYETAVSQAKQFPQVTAFDFQPGEAATGVFSDEETKRYIQFNEEGNVFKSAPYLDDLWIPTIGWGFALGYKDKNGVLHKSGDAKKRIDEAGKAGLLVDEKGKKLTFEDFWKEAFTATPKNLLPQWLGDKWFNDDYDGAKRIAANTFASFSRQDFPALARSVLIDMAYNLGDTRLAGFTKMIRALNAATPDFVCAGFELMDSDYAVQVGPRAIRNFRILVAGHEPKL